MTTPMERYDACTKRFRDGQMTEAIDELQKLTEEFPDFALAYNALGAYYKKNEDFDRAIQCAEKYCELEPEDSFGYSILSSYCIASGEKEKAEDALMRAQDLRLKNRLEGKP